jgi:hypothetical protein
VVSTSVPIVLCNRAISAIGTRSQIASLNEDSPEATQCLLIFEPTRKSLLQSAHWDFARATAYLTLLKALPGTPESPNAPTANRWDPTTMPPPPWLYSYAYPPDCIQIRYVAPQMFLGGAMPSGIPMFSVPTTIPTLQAGLQAQPFAVAADRDIQNFDITVVLTNQSQAIAIYTRDITNPGLWSSLFQDALVDSLSAQLAMALTGNLTLARAKAQSAMSSITIARARDGNEGLTIDDHTPEWLRVRGYAGDWTTVPYNWGAWTTPSFLLI